MLHRISVSRCMDRRMIHWTSIWQVQAWGGSGNGPLLILSCCIFLHSLGCFSTKSLCCSISFHRRLLDSLSHRFALGFGPLLLVMDVGRCLETQVFFVDVIQIEDK